MAREFLTGIKSENRLSKVRLIMPNDPVIGGQPSDNADEFTSNTPFLDLACSVQYSLDEVAKKANSTVNITAGNGLSGGGTLAANRTITLGTPTKITATSTNSVTTTSHTHEIDNASLTVAGVVKLNSATNSTLETEAATPNAVKTVMDAVAAKANNNVSITAGNGLSGGGTLAATRTITLGTPTKITATSTNSVTTTSHTHEIDNASTTVAGVVQLNNTVTSTSTTQAATANAVKLAYDRATSAMTTVVQTTGTSTTSVMSQKAATDAINTKITGGSVVQTTGTSTTNVMSQNAIAKLLGGLLKKPIDVMSSRTVGTLYTNSTGGIIIVVVSCAYPGGADRYPVTVEVDGVDIIPYMIRANTFQFSITAIVPPNSTYKVKVTEANFSSWVEYR